LPRKTTPEDAAKALLTRRVSAAGVTYPLRTIGPDGRPAEVMRFAAQGEEFTASAAAILDLDCVGSLAPPGATLEDVEREVQAKIARYRAQRSTMGSLS
jgi:hypothetical protein